MIWWFARIKLDRIVARMCPAQILSIPRQLCLMKSHVLVCEPLKFLSKLRLVGCPVGCSHTTAQSRSLKEGHLCSLQVATDLLVPKQRMEQHMHYAATKCNWLMYSTLCTTVYPTVGLETVFRLLPSGASSWHSGLHEGSKQTPQSRQAL